MLIKKFQSNSTYIFNTSYCVLTTLFICSILVLCCFFPSLTFLQLSCCVFIIFLLEFSLYVNFVRTLQSALKFLTCLCYLSRQAFCSISRFSFLIAAKIFQFQLCPYIYVSYCVASSTRNSSRTATMRDFLRYTPTSKQEVLETVIN